MCGICGFSGSKEFDHQTVLETMNEAIIHRGPDEDGFFSEKGVGLAMRRLSIIDLEHGTQPIYNQTKDVVTVFNGEIYNYKELRNELKAKGYVFKTESDTEVIVHLYDEYAEQFVTKLRGMFGIALWDLKTQELFLARDHLGIKPLYYALQDGQIYFASEMKSITASNQLSLTLNHQAIDSFLTYMFVPAPLSIFNEILKLEPGHYLRFKSTDNYTITKYWDFDFKPQKEHIDLQEIENAIQTSIDLHLNADVKLGTFVSGGIDSSLVAALASKKSKEPLNAYTVYFTGENNHMDDERPYVRELAKQYNLNNFEIKCDPNFFDVIDDIVNSFDEPFGDDGIIPNYYVCKHTAEHVKVALSGLGGDELFAGYSRHKGIRLASHFSWIPNSILAIIKLIVNKLPEPENGAEKINHLKRFVNSLNSDLSQTYYGFMCSLMPKQREKIYSEKLINNIDFEETKKFVVDKFNKPSSKDPIDRALYTDLHLYMPDQILTLSDRLSMCHSLEVRVPLADKEVVELSTKIDSKFKLFKNNGKYILKQVAAKFLPQSIITHKKQGFEPPMSSWMKIELRAYMQETLSDQNLNKHGLFNNQEISKLIYEHQNNIQKHNKILFCLLMFQLWYEKNEHLFSFPSKT